MKGMRSRSQMEHTVRGIGDVEASPAQSCAEDRSKIASSTGRGWGCSPLLGPVSTCLLGPEPTLRPAFSQSSGSLSHLGQSILRGFSSWLTEPSPARSQASLGSSLSSEGAHFCLLASSFLSPAWFPQVWVQGSTAYPRPLLACRLSQVPGALTLVLSPAAYSCVTQEKDSPL